MAHHSQAKILNGVRQQVGIQAGVRQLQQIRAGECQQPMPRDWPKGGRIPLEAQSLQPQTHLLPRPLIWARLHKCFQDLLTDGDIFSYRLAQSQAHPANAIDLPSL